MPILERNSKVYLAIIFLSITLAVTVHPLFLLLWPGVLVLDDIAYFFFARSLFDTEIAVQRGYQFADFFYDDQSGHGRDLGFNFYDNDLSKPANKAQQDKWDFMLNKLNLKPGDKLVDIGCGYGDWLNYARSKGVEVIGVNISPEQAKYGQENYGLDVIVTNWKDIASSPTLRDRIYRRFDAVTFMDTVEHYVPSKYRNKHEKKGEIYTSMFELAHNLLKDQSLSNRVFISCLHMTRGPSSLKDFFACYLQTRFHSGFYPVGDDGLTRWISGYFSEIGRYDQTEDYRLTSVFDTKHFGAPKIDWTGKKMFRLLLLFLIDPHHIHKWLEIKTDAWMWHFGNDAFNKNYDRDYQKKLSHVTLWWLVLQKNPNPASGRAQHFVSPNS